MLFDSILANGFSHVQTHHITVAKCEVIIPSKGMEYIMDELDNSLVALLVSLDGHIYPKLSR